MKSIYIEAIVAGILFLWSVCNTVGKEDSGIRDFYPITIGGAIQIWITVIIAFITWLNSSGG